MIKIVIGYGRNDAGGDEFNLNFRRPVKSILRGGLGNQLFCWAAAFSLGLRLERPVSLLAHKIQRNDHHLLDPRAFELDYFGLTPEYPRLRFEHKMPAIQCLKRTPILAGAWSGQVFKEGGFEYDPRFIQISRPKTLDGYFQSWRYFEDCDQIIRSMLNQSANFTQEGERIRETLSQDPWVGVHVRRGDYSKVGVMQLPDSRYYSRATALAKKISGVDKVVVFSDEIDVAAQIVPDAHEYIGASRLSKPGDVMMLLAESKGIVGANSTLSWWSAFLNGNTEAPRLFPKTWFTDPNLDTTDLLPSDWIRVEN